MNVSSIYFEDGCSEQLFTPRPTASMTAPRPSRRREDSRRRRSAPQQFNGIHRRRRKKIRW